MIDKTLKLYQSAASPNSRRVRIFLAEKGLELTLVPVDMSVVRVGQAHARDMTVEATDFRGR